MLKTCFELRGPLVVAVALGKLRHPEEAPLPPPSRLQEAPTPPVTSLNVPQEAPTAAPTNLPNAAPETSYPETAYPASTPVGGGGLFGRVGLTPVALFRQPPLSSSNAPPGGRPGGGAPVVVEPCAVRGVTYLLGIPVTTADWEHANTIARQFFIISLEGAEQDFAYRTKFAFSIWNKYEQESTYNNRLTKMQLFSNLTTLKQAESEPVQD